MAKTCCSFLWAGMVFLVFLVPAEAKKDVKVAVPQTNAKSISVEDYLVDKASIRGKITVRGSVACLNGSMCYLYGNNIMTSMTFDPTRLSRNDRLRLLSCNPMIVSCIVSITGSNKPGDSLVSLSADSIAWEPSEEDVAASDPSRPSCAAVGISEVKHMVEDSPLVKMFRLNVEDIHVSTSPDKDGHIHCVATVITSGGEKKLRYYVMREEGTNKFYVTGTWVP